MKPNETRLVIELDRRLHFTLKRKAIDSGLTLKKWVLKAIANQIKIEEDQVEKFNNDLELRFKNVE